MLKRSTESSLREYQGQNTRQVKDRLLCDSLVLDWESALAKRTVEDAEIHRESYAQLKQSIQSDTPEEESPKETEAGPSGTAGDIIQPATGQSDEEDTRLTE